MSKKIQPKCKEALCSVSVGGKVQIVKFEYQATFHYSMSRTYAIPSGWTEQDVIDFQIDKEVQLRGELEPVANDEMRKLEKQRAELNNEPYEE